MNVFMHDSLIALKTPKVFHKKENNKIHFMLSFLGPDQCNGFVKPIIMGVQHMCYLNKIILKEILSKWTLNFKTLLYMHKVTVSCMLTISLVYWTKSSQDHMIVVVRTLKRKLT